MPHETPNKLEQLIAIFHEKLPELKELTFGCEVKHNGNDCFYECTVPDFGKIIRVETEKNTKWRWFFFEDGRRIHEEELDCCGEILGQPIQLHDVLRVIGKNAYYSIDHASDGSIFLIMDRENTHPRAEWNLSTELSGQSPKVIEFLLSLLQVDTNQE